MATSLKDIVEAVYPEQDFAVGNDIVFLPEFRASWNELFEKKVYTREEIEYCTQFSDPVLRYASTWAAKEACYKALKQVCTELIGPRAISISRKKPAGQPEARLLKNGDNFQISLSISHDGEYVWAVAVVKKMLK